MQIGRSINRGIAPFRPASSDDRSAQGGGLWHRPLTIAFLGLAVLSVAYLAQMTGRPVSAALLAVLGVVTVGALLGLWAGVAAGLVASLTYNLIFTAPFLRFSLASTDDLVPVIVLNVSAVASGLIAGKLHDRAVVAEEAKHRVAELLHFSEELQRAVTLVDLERVAECYFGGERRRAQLFVERSGRLEAASALTWGLTAREVWHLGLPYLTRDDQTGFLLKSGERRLGVLVVWAGHPEEIKAFLPLLALAIERCEMAERLSGSDVLGGLE